VVIAGFEPATSFRTRDGALTLAAGLPAHR
jgi:hypothetical protein